MARNKLGVATYSLDDCRMGECSPLIVKSGISTLGNNTRVVAEIFPEFMDVDSGKGLGSIYSIT